MYVIQSDLKSPIHTVDQVIAKNPSTTSITAKRPRLGGVRSFSAALMQVHSLPWHMDGPFSDDEWLFLAGHLVNDRPTACPVNRRAKKGVILGDMIFLDAEKFLLAVKSRTGALHMSLVPLIWPV